MRVLQLLERTVNTALEPLGIRIVRSGPAPTIGGRRLSDRDVIARARERGVSPGDFVEELFGRQGRAHGIIQRMKECGAVSDRVSSICEIGAGSGLYVENLLKHVRPRTYEIYEIGRERAEYLGRTYPVVVRPADGETLKSTVSKSVHLVHAHGVFVTTEFLTTYSYFLEIERVVAPGGYAVFDVITEDCLGDEDLDSWMKTRLRYATMLTRQQVLEFFTKRGFRVVDEFQLPLLVHGSSRYFIMRMDGDAR